MQNPTLDMEEALTPCSIANITYCSCYLCLNCRMLTHLKKSHKFASCCVCHGELCFLSATIYEFEAVPLKEKIEFNVPKNVQIERFKVQQAIVTALLEHVCFCIVVADFFY